ncbi:hypothetical protein T484DRAFT_1758126, partial [Baffinella frigidus]
ALPPGRNIRQRAGACVHVPSPSGGEGGVRKRLFCSSHAVLRLRRKRALEKVNGARLSMRRNGNPSLRPAAIITPSYSARAATAREQLQHEQPQHKQPQHASSHNTRAATAREQPQHASSHSTSSHNTRAATAISKCLFNS